MEDNHAVVQEDPAAFVSALDSDLLDPLLRQSRLHFLGDVFGLNSGRSARYDKAITHGSEFGHIEQENILRFDFIGCLSRYVSYFYTFQIALFPSQQ